MLNPAVAEYFLSKRLCLNLHPAKAGLSIYGAMQPTNSATADLILNLIFD
jgi:hypothetical protein